MVSPLQLPVLLTQLPQLQKVQHAIQSHPDAYQAQAAKEVAEEQKKSQNQVPKTETTDGALRVRPDANRDRGGSQHRKRQQEKAGGEVQQESPEQAASGLIIDLKV
jgi:hypothetical protein